MTARKDEEGTRSGSLFSCQKIVFFCEVWSGMWSNHREAAKIKGTVLIMV